MKRMWVFNFCFLYVGTEVHYMHSQDHSVLFLPSDADLLQGKYKHSHSLKRKCILCEYNAHIEYFSRSWLLDGLNIKYNWFLQFSTVYIKVGFINIDINILLYLNVIYLLLTLTRCTISFNALCFNGFIVNIKSFFLDFKGWHTVI